MPPMAAGLVKLAVVPKGDGICVGNFQMTSNVEIASIWDLIEVIAQSRVAK
jgi:hypothetical protein